ncbi:hypothetical protein K469DRAFT_239433 [Zopfia rhizophila CBS 207.26]|uniref:Uncharacterized protein n=1 Tax=Zopfia rhizophila CBS 207.26 TaxID=1314779 RepID=A0A6A6EU65_9PEZI|nr:hypothetical protein K469DRAFT_239433 [Zopfia rhizophila CBS 207.26]
MQGNCVTQVPRLTSRYIARFTSMFAQPSRRPSCLRSSICISGIRMRRRVTRQFRVAICASSINMCFTALAKMLRSQVR